MRLTSAFASGALLYMSALMPHLLTHPAGYWRWPAHHLCICPVMFCIHLQTDCCKLIGLLEVHNQSILLRRLMKIFIHHKAAKYDNNSNGTIKTRTKNTMTKRVEYKLCRNVNRCLHGEAPRYLADLITPSAAGTTRAGLNLPRLALSQCHVPRWPLVQCGCSARLEESAAITSSSWFR